MSEEYKMPLEQMRQVLNREVVEPFIESMCTDIEVSLKLSNALYLTRFTEILITESLSNQVKSSQIPRNIKEQFLFLGYFGKLYQSSLYLLGATDYLGSIVLMRSLFELLVGISTEITGSMKERISSIDFLSSEEKNNVKKFWDNLCSWSHPYGKWIKDVCPRLYGSGRFYQPKLFNLCLEYSDSILDFMLTVIVEVLHSSIDEYKHSLATYAIPELSMFSKRISSYDS